MIPANTKKHCHIYLFILAIVKRELRQPTCKSAWLPKVASSNPGRTRGRIFFSRVNHVCWLFFGVNSTPMLPQWHVKDPGHSAKSAGVWLHLNMRTPLTQQSRSGLTIPLCRHRVGTYLGRSSHATCPGTFSHSCLSSLSYCGLILALKVELVCLRSNILPKSSQGRKKPPPWICCNR